MVPRWVTILLGLHLGAGYILVAAPEVLLGLPAPFTYAFRASVCVASVWAAWLAIRDRAWALPRWETLAIVTVMAFLVYRLAMMAMVPNPQSMVPPERYWAAFFGIVAVPAAGFGMAISRARLAMLSNWVLWSCLASVPLFVLAALSLPSVVKDVPRLGTDRVNPIVIGSAASLIAVFGLVNRFQIGRPRSFTALSGWSPLLLAGLGWFLIALTASRGPFFIGILCCLILVPFSRGVAWSGRLWAVAEQGVSCVLGYFLVIKLTPYNMFARLANGATIESDEAFGRVPVLRRALGLFLDHPITGTSPLDPRTGIYPHNQLVEMFVAAGVVGGVVMLYLLLRAATQVWRLSQDSEYRWVAALAIIAIGASFNSSSLFLDGRFWAAILLVLAVRPEPDLAGGPGEGPTGEQVHVKVRY